MLLTRRVYADLAGIWYPGQPKWTWPVLLPWPVYVDLARRGGPGQQKWTCTGPKVDLVSHVDLVRTADLASISGPGQPKWTGTWPKVVLVSKVDLVSTADLASIGGQDSQSGPRPVQVNQPRWNSADSGQVQWSELSSGPGQYC